HWTAATAPCWVASQAWADSAATWFSPCGASWYNSKVVSGQQSVEMHPGLHALATASPCHYSLLSSDYCLLERSNMDAAPSPVGVAAAPPLPPPVWPQPAQRPAPPAPPSVALPAAPPVWTPSAQRATAVMLAAALGLLGWHVWSSQRQACRPTVAQAD